MEPISFGVTLKKIRLWKGVTQADLAHSLDISKTSISAYEKGRVPSKPTIDKMTQYFEYELKNPRGELTTLAETTLVFIDYLNSKPCMIPKNFKSLLINS